MIGVASGQFMVGAGGCRIWLSVLLLFLLLGLHATVLEPNFDLALAEGQRVGDFDAPPPRQVAVEVELFLQFQRLEARVRLTGAFRVGPHFCKLLK